MLLVLGALVVLLATTAMIARSRATDSIAARLHADFLDAISTAESTHEPVLAWLESESRNVIIHPDSLSPMFSVMNDTFQVGEKQVLITVTAWDQFAMPPIGEQIDIDQPVSGLDEIRKPFSVYPSLLKHDRLGASIATHNPVPGQQTRGNTLPSVNLNTTPILRLNQLFSRFNVSGLDSVLSARASNEHAHATSLRFNSDTPYRFVSSSQSWSIRTDVKFGLASLSLWSVYIQRGDVWMLEQRIVIPN